jgi:hypothetical protein
MIGARCSASNSSASMRKASRLPHNLRTTTTSTFRVTSRVALQIHARDAKYNERRRDRRRDQARETVPQKRRRDRCSLSVPGRPIVVTFENGIEIRFPRLQLEGLENATDVQLSDIEIDAGRLLVWTKIADGAKEDAVVAHCIPDVMDKFAPSGRVMTEIGRLGDSKTSPAKAAAVRANGKKGGRPRTRALPFPI